ncbi:MAG: hypothetical protein ACP5IB_09595 [Thermoplasmata archaeon]
MNRRGTNEYGKNEKMVVKKTVKEYLETLMKTERDVFIDEYEGTKNGFYERKP